MHQKLSRISNAGKITVATGIFALLVVTALSTVGVMSSTADAKNATSTVKVLNTPPQLNGDVTEVVPSSATTPTSYGLNLAWTAQYRDSSNHGTYLLICSAAGAPTASSSTAPTCNGGNGNRIAYSDAPVVGAFPAWTAIYATTTNPINDQVNESQVWYAWLCDNDAQNPKCSVAANQGGASGDAGSPYNINHPHSYTLLSNNGPIAPGAAMTFTASSSETIHTDVVGGIDTIKLFVCKANDFNPALGACGAGGTWASTTVAVQTNATAQVTFPVPTRDGNYDAYAYILDNHNAEPVVGGVQGAYSTFTVSNVAPTIELASISLTDAATSTTLKLTQERGETEGFSLKFNVIDNNSCVNQASNPEVAGAAIAVYRSGVADAACNGVTPGQHNYNSCYSSGDTSAVWNVVCAQDGVDPCSGPTDNKVSWSCTFPLWYTTDPTDAGTPWAAQTMSVNIIPRDDNNATTSNPRVTSSEMWSFLALDLSSYTLNFGEFEPGQGGKPLGRDHNDAANAVLGVQATGNVALDTSVQGTDMCIGPGACSGNSNDTIPAAQEHYGLVLDTPYAGGILVSSTTPNLLQLNVDKTTSTSTPASKPIYWSIFVPGALTVSGDYKGTNFIEGQVDDRGVW